MNFFTFFLKHKVKNSKAIPTANSLAFLLQYKNSISEAVSVSKSDQDSVGYLKNITETLGIKYRHIQCNSSSPYDSLALAAVQNNSNLVAFDDVLENRQRHFSSMKNSMRPFMQAKGYLPGNSSYCMHVDFIRPNLNVSSETVRNVCDASGFEFLQVASFDPIDKSYSVDFINEQENILKALDLRVFQIFENQMTLDPSLGMIILRNPSSWLGNREISTRILWYVLEYITGKAIQASIQEMEQLVKDFELAISQNVNFSRYGCLFSRHGKIHNWLVSRCKLSKFEVMNSIFESFPGKVYTWDNRFYLNFNLTDKSDTQRKFIMRPFLNSDRETMSYNLRHNLIEAETFGHKYKISEALYLFKNLPDRSRETIPCIAEVTDKEQSKDSVVAVPSLDIVVSNIGEFKISSKSHARFLRRAEEIKLNA